MIHRLLPLFALAVPVLAQSPDPLVTVPPATPTTTTTVSHLGTVTGFTDRASWLTAAGGATTLIDFESIADGTVITTELSPFGVSLVEGASPNEAPAGATTVRVTSSASLPFPMFIAGTLPSETHFISNRLESPVFSTGTLTYTFDSPRSAVGAYIADQSVLANDEIELFDAGGASIGVFSTPGVVLPNSFIGVTSTTPFTRAQFRSASGTDSWGMDDLEFNGEGGGSMSLGCDPANNHSGGGYVTLDQSTFSGPGVLHLEATDGVPGEFGYFLVSAVLNDPGASVANGMLCLGAPVGRYAPAAGGALNSIGQFDAGGQFQSLSGNSTVGSGYDVLAGLPSPPGGAIASGDTWYFQCWYRDGQRSNFSNALSVTFP